MRIYHWAAIAARGSEGVNAAIFTSSFFTVYSGGGGGAPGETPDITWLVL